MCQAEGIQLYRILLTDINGEYSWTMPWERVPPERGISFISSSVDLLYCWYWSRGGTGHMLAMSEN